MKRSESMKEVRARRAAAAVEAKRDPRPTQQIVAEARRTTAQRRVDTAGTFSGAVALHTKNVRKQTKRSPRRD